MGACIRKPLANPTCSEKHHQVEKRKNHTKYDGHNNVVQEGISPPGYGPENAAAIKQSRVFTSFNLKMFSLAELKTATADFGPKTLLGEGGFGWVFKGWVDENSFAPCDLGVGIAVAVKKCKPDSEQGLKHWQAEVKLLGKFCHPNLVNLLGYCNENSELLLVYEYMQNGSLERHLFNEDADPLSWETRLKIAIGAARGLTFLHTTEKQVIYRDFKPSNILLDEDFNAKLSDFGLARFGPVNGKSHVTTEVAGTYGYAAPEYIASGHLYVKSDVYGFGVVLLEIITGLRVVDVKRPAKMYNLVKWAKPFLDKKDVSQIMDPRLKGQYSSWGASEMAALIADCLPPDPKTRPSMEEVLDKLEEIRIEADRERGNLVWRIF